jgi:hypothetical protein
MASQFKVNSTRRSWSEDPPIQSSLTFPGELSGFHSVDLLLAKSRGRKNPAFPFEQELAIYLLLIFSLWPNDRDRLLAAAKIFSGAINLHLSPGLNGEDVNGQRPARGLSRFNRVFFSTIGGWPSLLACPSAAQFHREVWSRVNELAMTHDVVEFMLKAGRVSPKLGSLALAYKAVAHNVFSREGGYGVPKGLKRQYDGVTTANTVRASWRKHRSNAALSYAVTRYHMTHLYDPTSSAFWRNLLDAKKRPADALLHFVAKILKDTRSKQTELANLALPDVSKVSVIFSPLFTVEETERVLQIATTVRRRALPPELIKKARELAETWSRQIPRLA